MHVVLSILIAVIQVAGPWLCCCGPQRLTALLTSTSDTPTTISVPVSRVPAQVPGTCPHCPKHETPTPTEPETPTPAPTPNHLPDQCPCGGVTLEAVPAERTLTVDLHVAPVEFPNLFVLAPSLLVVSQTVADVPGLRELPYLTVHDILYKHHVLRC